MAPLTYRTALITGASSGIGAALARRLAATGTEVILSARRNSELQEQANAISDAGGQCHVVVLDLRDPRATEQTVAELDKKFQFDLVIANAGVGRLVPGQELSWDTCEDIIAVNVSGAIATLLGALPGMLARGRGQLVGVSSVGQGLGMPHNGTYMASKAFLATFLASLRNDLHATGIAVSDARPGIIDTPMTETLARRPFVISADEAASSILDGVQRREAVIAFPVSARLMAASFRMMPNRLFQSVMRWMKDH